MSYASGIISWEQIETASIYEEDCLYKMVAKESAPTCTDILVEVINVTMWNEW